MVKGEVPVKRLLPKMSPEALSEQLLLLTLATEQALIKEDFSEASALLNRREQLLAILGELKQSDRSRRTLVEVQRRERSLMDSLQRWKSSIVDEMAVGIRSRKMAGTYHQTACAVVDQRG